MSLGTKGDLLVVTNNRQRVFQRSIIDGAREGAAARGYGLDVLELPQPTDAEAALGALRRTPAGVLLVADVLPDTAVARLWDEGITLTLVSHRVQGLAAPSIMHDNGQGIEQLAAHLLDEGGRRRPLFLRGSPRQLDARQREQAFRRELMRRTLNVDRVPFVRGDFEPDTAREELARQLDREPGFDALLAADYLMAIAARELLQARGVRVPEEVAVAGFGDGPEAEASGLTTVAADVVELGRRAARQLVGQIEGLRVRGLTLLSTTLLRRESTALAAAPAARASRGAPAGPAATD